MNRINSNKKGFTLVELCVVIALIAIAMLLMTTFITSFQARSAQSAARHEFLDEISIVRDELQCWITTYDTYGNEVKVTHAGTLVAHDNGTVSVNFVDSTFVFTYGNASEPRIINVKNIERIELSVDDQSGGRLLKCTFIGCDPFGTEYSQSMLFSLSSTNAKFTVSSGG